MQYALLIPAAVLAQSTQAPDIVSALHRVAFQGVTGPIAFDAHGDLREPAATLSTYHRDTKMALTEASK